MTAGDMRTEPDVLIDAILDAATHWLALGVPIARLLIAVRSDDTAAAARRGFARWRDARDPANGSVAYV